MDIDTGDTGHAGQLKIPGKEDVPLQRLKGLLVARVYCLRTNTLNQWLGILNPELTPL